MVVALVSNSSWIYPYYQLGIIESYEMLNLKLMGESQPHKEGFIFYLIFRSLKVKVECLLSDNSFWVGEDYPNPSPSSIKSTINMESQVLPIDSNSTYAGLASASSKTIHSMMKFDNA